MRQVTGKTNPPESGYKVSIQQSLDGHSFSCSPLPDPTGDETTLEVEVCSARTVLAPAEYFESAKAAALLAAEGISPAGDEAVVWSDPAAELVAVMALPRTIHEQLAARFGTRIRYTAPLLAGPDAVENCVWVLSRSSLLYVKVYAQEGQLQLAEVITAPDEAEIRYFFERLAAAFPLAEYGLQAAGDDPKRLCRLIGHLFKNTTCA